MTTSFREATAPDALPRDDLGRAERRYVPDPSSTTVEDAAPTHLRDVRRDCRDDATPGIRLVGQDANDVECEAFRLEGDARAGRGVDR